MRYLYTSGLVADQGKKPLAYEPGIFGKERFVLLSSGEIVRMSEEDLPRGTGGKATVMRRSFVRLLLVIGALFVLACLGQAVPFRIRVFLAARLGPLSLQSLARRCGSTRSAVATAMVCLVLLTAGLHRFASWLYRQIWDSIGSRPIQRCCAAGTGAGPPGWSAGFCSCSSRGSRPWASRTRPRGCC